MLLIDMKCIKYLPESIVLINNFFFKCLNYYNKLISYFESQRSINKENPMIMICECAIFCI